jgi:hypothetical protein
MKTENKYEIGEKTFTFKRRTYALEDRVRKMAGIDDETANELQRLYSSYKDLQKAFTAIDPLDEKAESKKAELNETMGQMNVQIMGLATKMLWYDSFEKSKAVLNEMFNEDASCLTDEDFGRSTSIEVWNDFFSVPTMNKRS